MKDLSVLVVDDSALYRTIVGRGVESIPNAHVVGYAKDGLEALAMVQSLRPDLVLLDIEMPHLDGLQTLEALRRLGSPTGVIMVSSLDLGSRSKTLSAVQAGAFDLVAKPGAAKEGRAKDSFRSDIRAAIEAFRYSQAHQPGAGGSAAAPPAYKFGPAAQEPVGGTQKFELMVLGISTGGPAALSKLIPKLPAHFRLPIVIVQHMPAGFTKHLADTLHRLSAVQVVEGESEMALTPGRVVIAPGGFHLSLKGNRSAPRVALDEGPTVNGARPAVDRLFESAAQLFGSQTLGVIMTGMGTDGLQGAHAIRKAGGYCMAQDQASSVVYGMPRAVVEAGLANEVVGLEAMDVRLGFLASANPRKVA